MSLLKVYPEDDVCATTRPGVATSAATNTFATRMSKKSLSV
jgi:hypothetical protein